MAEDIWKKIVGNAIPILLVALFSILGFLVLQIFLLNNKINENKLEDVKHYMELDRKFEVQKVTVNNIKNMVERMRHLGGSSNEDFSSMDLFDYSDLYSLYPLDFLSNKR